MFTLDEKGRIIKRKKEVFSLTKSELLILSVLKDTKVHSDEELLKCLYGDGNTYSRTNLSVLIHRLKEKTGLLISRIRGTGYMLLDEIKEEE